MTTKTIDKLTTNYTAHVQQHRHYHQNVPPDVFYIEIRLKLDHHNSLHVVTIEQSS